MNAASNDKVEMLENERGTTSSRISFSEGEDEGNGRGDSVVPSHGVEAEETEGESIGAVAVESKQICCSISCCSSCVRLIVCNISMTCFVNEDAFSNSLSSRLRFRGCGVEDNSRGAFRRLSFLRRICSGFETTRIAALFIDASHGIPMQFQR